MLRRRAERSWAEPSRAKPSRAESSRTEPRRTDNESAEPGDFKKIFIIINILSLKNIFVHLLQIYFIHIQMFYSTSTSHTFFLRAIKKLERK